MTTDLDWHDHLMCLALDSTLPHVGPAYLALRPRDHLYLARLARRGIISTAHALMAAVQQYLESPNYRVPIN